MELVVQDGQLNSAPFRVFLDRSITRENQPRIQFLAAHAITTPLPGEDRLHPPLVVAPNQAVTVTGPAGQISRCGTLMYFDVGSYPIEFYKPMRRIIPVLSWIPPGGAEAQRAVLAVAARPVNLGQPVAAWVWTVLLMGLLTFGIFAMAVPLRNAIRRFRARFMTGAGTGSGSTETTGPASSPFCLLCSGDGHLSLSKVQIALWTLAIATAVFFYGTIRLTLPSIPDSLVVLMGLSLATGGASYLAVPPTASTPAPGRAVPAPPPAGPAGEARGPHLSDLIRNFPQEGPPELSVSRAQMLLWTVLLIILFIWKSALDGVLWELPWQLVALTGISQLGYLAPKFAPDPASR